MEDYVFTYLYQYAKTRGNKEKVAVLCGKFFQKDGQAILIICGAIQGKYSVNDNGIEMFSEESWQYIREQMKTYFNGMEIVGWMHAQPGFGGEVAQAAKDWHMENFTGPYHVIYALDSLERSDSFYIYNDDQTELEQAKGYFVYYDRNESMHEYMLENSFLNMLKADEMEALENLEDEYKEKKPPKKQKEQPEIKEVKKTSAGRERKSYREDYSLRRMVNMMGSLSAVLFLVCFVMGVGLIQNRDRISQLEGDLVNLNAGYRNIVAALSGENTSPVFAADQVNPNGQGQVIQMDGSAITELVEEPTDITVEPVPVTEEMASVESATEAEAVSEDLTSEEPVQEAMGQDEIKTYVVEEGDTLSQISVKFYQTKDMMEKIMEANGIDNPDMIMIGKEIIIP